jgi:hypothetical protein
MLFTRKEDKERAITILAEQMSCASSAAVAQVCMASTHDVSFKVRNNETNGSDEFNDMFYEIAKKLIESVG